MTAVTYPSDSTRELRPKVSRVQIAYNLASRRLIPDAETVERQNLGIRKAGAAALILTLL